MWGARDWVHGRRGIHRQRWTTCDREQVESSALQYASLDEAKVERLEFQAGGPIPYISHSEAPDDPDSCNRHAAERREGPADENGAELAAGIGTDPDEHKGLEYYHHMHPSGSKPGR